MSAVVDVGLWMVAIGCGVMAGVYFAFSTFVMRALAAISQPEGVAAMQSINKVVLSSAFMPLFFGTSLIAMILAGWSLTGWREPGAWLLLVGGLTYVVGMFACTAFFNLPLNETLAAIDPAAAEAATRWPDYLRRWTRWSHVRMVASLVSCALFVLAIVRRG